MLQKIMPWVVQLANRYHGGYALAAVLLAWGMTFCIAGLSSYLALLFVLNTLLYPLHRSMLLVLGIVLSLSLFLEVADRRGGLDAGDCVAGLLACCLLNTLGRWQSWWETNGVQASSFGALMGNVGKRLRSPAMFQWLEPVWIGLVAVVCLSAATGLLLWVPLNRNAVIEYRMFPPIFRLVQLGSLLLVAYVVYTVIAYELAWRRMTPGQARIYLRGTLFGWLGSELRRIARRRKRMA